MKLIIAIVVLLIAGCSENIESYELNESYAACAAHNGVHRITVYPTNAIKTICNDGITNNYIKDDRDNKNK
jgi:hypothetical protein